MSELFEKEGFDQIKMVDIAKYCGISVGALYKLFPSKEDLFYDYIQYQIDLFYKQLQERFNVVKTPKQRLKLFIDMMFHTFTSKKRLFMDTAAGDPLFFAKLALKRDNPAKKIYKLLEREFEKLENRKISDTKQLAILFKSFLYGYIEYWLIHDQPIKTCSEEALELFLHGIVKE